MGSVAGDLGVGGGTEGLKSGGKLGWVEGVGLDPEELVGIGED